MSRVGPLYEKVKHHITDGIVSGRFQPGTRLPSESDLVRDLAVSRMTVNRALRELTRDGLIYRMQGVGSFVSEAGPSTSLAEVRDIRSIIAERGGTYGCRVLESGAKPLDQQNADLFNLEAGQQVFSLLLLHLEDGAPLQLETRYVCRDFAPELLEQDFSRCSLFEYLHRIAPVTELEHLVEATLADQVEQEFLEIGAGHPVLRIRRRTWVGRKVVTVGYFSHPGDRYRVAVRLHPSDLVRSGAG